MAPWVFLYGVTGFLFNHPDAFPDREVRAIGRRELAGTSLAGLPSPVDLAARVIRGLSASEGREARSDFRLVRPEDVAYSRDLIASAVGDGREHSIQLDLATGTGTIRSTAGRGQQPGLRFVGGSVVKMDDPPLDRIRRGLPLILARRGLTCDGVSIRTSPDLVFAMEAGGRTWRVSYNLQSGAVSVRPDDTDGDALTTRSFLTRLHLARTYPSRRDARWFWAMAVDLMSATMVFWGASGVLMWWQLKALRRSGAVVLLASSAVAGLLALGMHVLLA
jgi:hypothetical protein